VIDVTVETTDPTEDESRIKFPQLYDRELMRRLYLDESKSTEQIADEVGCSPVRVARALHRHQIPLRNAGPAPTLTGLAREAIIAKAGEIDSLSMLAAHFNVTWPTLESYCYRVGIDKDMLKKVIRSGRLKRRQAHLDSLAAQSAARRQSKEELRTGVVEMYLEGASIDEIGAAFARHPSGIWRILSDAGVDTTARNRHRSSTPMPTLTDASAISVKELILHLSRMNPAAELEFYDVHTENRLRLALITQATDLPVVRVALDVIDPDTKDVSGS
jgi:hypothetical protein